MRRERLSATSQVCSTVSSRMVDSGIKPVYVKEVDKLLVRLLRKDGIRMLFSQGVAGGTNFKCKLPDSVG